MDTDVQQWDRQKGESAKSFAAFVLYRDGGPAYSLARLYDDHFGDRGTRLRTLERWSSDNGWVARRQAYYDHLDRLRQARRLHAVAQSETLLIEAAEWIMAASVKAALEGDVRAQKDLLDRLGLTRKKAESEEKAGLTMSVDAIAAVMQNSTLPELVAVLNSLEKVGK